MQPPPHAPLPVDLEDLLQRIERWRTTRPKRGRMPTELWEEAARLAKLHGIYRISKALRLNYEALKAWAAGSGQKVEQAVAPRKPAFLQIHPSTTAVYSPEGVEVETPGGAKMRIRLTAPTMVEVVALLQAFLLHEHR